MQKTFVLVHGSWHGSWCWKEVARLLRAGGDEVYTPNLSGCGASAHVLERGARIDLEAHIEDVVQTLFYEDLRDVVLVGHSYGGLVVAGAAPRCTGRLKGMVLLDGYVVDPGQTGFSFWTEAKAAAARQAMTAGERFRMPVSAAALGVDDPAQAEWLVARLTPHPWACYEQPITEQAVPGVYIRCTEGPLVASFESSQSRAVARGWPVLTLATGHDAMLTLPAQTALQLRLAAEMMGGQDKNPGEAGLSL